MYFFYKKSTFIISTVLKVYIYSNKIQKKTNYFMKPVLIVENSTNSLVRESSSTGKKDYILGGTFTEFGVKNRNERIYTAAKFLPALEEMNES